MNARSLTPNKFDVGIMPSPANLIKSKTGVSALSEESGSGSDRVILICHTTFEV